MPFFFLKGFQSLIDFLTHPLILSALMDFTELRVSLWGEQGGAFKEEKFVLGLPKNPGLL